MTTILMKYTSYKVQVLEQANVYIRFWLCD